MNKILVGIIETEVSKNVADKAVKLAKLCGCDITFINVIDEKSSTGNMLDSIIDNYADYQIKMDKIIARGVAHEEIIKTAEEGGYDLIIVGHRSLGPVEQIFLGSVAKRVVEDAPCSVMVVK